MRSVISLKRRRNAHRNAPQTVCWHSWPIRSQMLTKTFCWGSLGSLPGETRGAVRLSHRISRHFKTWMEIWGPGSQGGLVTWVLDSGYSNQFLLCFVPSPVFPLNYKPLHPAEWRTITGCFFSSLYSLSSPSGDHEMFLSPRLLWDVTAGSIQREIGCN